MTRSIVPRWPFSGKWRMVGELCQQEGIVFVPRALESIWRLDQAAIWEVKRLGATWTSRHGPKRMWPLAI